MKYFSYRRCLITIFLKVLQHCRPPTSVGKGRDLYRCPQNEDIYQTSYRTREFLVYGDYTAFRNKGLFCWRSKFRNGRGYPHTSNLSFRWSIDMKNVYFLPGRGAWNQRDNDNKKTIDFIAPDYRHSVETSTFIVCGLPLSAINRYA